MAKRRKQRRRSSVRGGWLLATAVAAFALGFYWSERRSEEQPVSKPAAPAASAPSTAPVDRAVPAPERRVTEAVPEPAPPIVAVEPGGARIALVIDDLGRSVADLDQAQSLGIPWTGAVLPFETETAAVVGELRRRGIEFLCHLPMQPENANPGPGALRLDMTQSELAAATRAALTAVPGAVGVNNHMGSVLSADAAAMTTILNELMNRELYFLDSRTSPNSLGYRFALELGLPAIERQVFLDADPDERAVTIQFRRLLEVARRRGAALAIGHPHPYTFAVLQREVPAAIEAGYEFVPASYLLDRPALGVAGGVAQAAGSQQ